MFMDSFKFYWSLIEFMEGLIARKIDFEVNLGFNWKKLKFWGQIIIFKSYFDQNQGLNCVNIEVWWPIRDLIEEIQNQGPSWKRRVNRGTEIDSIRD